MKFILPEPIKGYIISLYEYPARDNKSEAKHFADIQLDNEREEIIAVIVPDQTKYQKFQKIQWLVEANLYDFKGMKGWNLTLKDEFNKKENTLKK